MLPGKTYRPEDYLQMAWRRAWVVVVPLIVFGVATSMWSRSVPNRYRSESKILVIPPQVAVTVENQVVTKQDGLQERLNLMRQQILSRPRLERIIEELNLYPKQRKELLMDEVVTQMLDDVGVTVPKAARRREPDNFVVSFDSEDPQTAFVVTERIASLFVRENLERRGNKVEATTEFLQSQVDEARRKLEEHEKRVEVFRRTHAGRLPEEVEANLQIMQSARGEVQAQTDAINRDRDRQITIERTIADEQALGPIVDGKGGVVVGQSAADQLVAANANLATLQLRLKDDHPDVKIAKSRIVELTKKADAEALQQPLSGEARGLPVNSAAAERARRLSGLRAEHETLGRAIVLKRAKVQQAQGKILDYQGRIQAGPMLETELSGLMRDYSTLKDTYEGMMRRAQEANLSANLEQRQGGEQFRIIEPARLPERPHSPKRGRVNLIGAMVGLGLGLVLAGLLEYRDTTVRTEEDVLVALSLPVVALVPTMWTGAELARLRRRRLILRSSVAATVLLSAAAILWKLS